MLATTYGSEYRYSATLPPLRFRYFVSFSRSNEDQLTPRSFPHYSLHISPHRNLDYERSQLGFGPTRAPYERAEETMKNVTNRAGLEIKVQGRGRLESELENPQDDEENEGTENQVLPRATGQRTDETFSLPEVQSVAQKIGQNEDRDLYHSVYKRTGTFKAEVVPKFWEIQQERRNLFEPERLKLPVGNLCPRNPTLLKQRRDLTQAAIAKMENVCSRQMKHGYVPKLPIITTPTLPTSRFKYLPSTQRCRPKAELDELSSKGRLSRLVTNTIPRHPCDLK